MSSKPQIAILGAGPTGLEAALAAHEHGYPFTLYEAAPAVSDHVRAWGHVRLFSPWSLDVSPRARKALAAAGHELPDSAECPTGAELCARVYDPLAALPAIAENLRLGVKVRAVSREGLLKNDEIGTGRRAERPFRLLLGGTASDGDGDSDGTGREWVETAGLVFDTTGTYGQPNATGDGGIPAPGESSLGDLVERRIPDVLGLPKGWAGRTTLLVGNGHSAQTALVALARLAERYPRTRIVWALRDPEPAWPVDSDDPLPERSRLVARARDLAHGGSPAIEVLTGVVVDRFERRNGGLEVSLRSTGGATTAVEVDRVLSLTGFVGDHTLYRQLQVHECYATSGPMKLAAALLGESSSDCLAQTSHGADTLTNPEPGFFILGSKSYGRNTTFLMRLGWEQVDEVFGLLG